MVVASLGAERGEELAKELDAVFREVTAAFALDMKNTYAIYDTGGQEPEAWIDAMSGLGVGQRFWAQDVARRRTFSRIPSFSFRGRDRQKLLPVSHAQQHRGHSINLRSVLLPSVTL